jgi:hypothetical protein
MKVVLYSALYGNYEHPKKVPQDLGVPAIMYTDNPDLHAPGWEVRVAPYTWGEEHPADPKATFAMMEHKFWKLHPHIISDADVSIWMDASMEITVDNYVERCLEALGDDDLVTVPHPARNCIYPEAAFSATLERYDAAAITRQVEFYRVWHPPNWGLFATGARVTRHTPRMRKFFSDWWWECTTRSHQDQLSFPVLLRLAEDIKWNRNMPWFQWWHLYEHGM